ncbi:hypothetical protein AAG589_05830 [Isoptericola sp. F-RaC21]|uniref:YqeB family protein n=1 Tax=Isoptericola sp. F-RaC21 TaxID=3141452 RepID=UPI00315BBD73
MSTTQVRQGRSVPVLIGLVALPVAVGLGFVLPPLARWVREASDGTPLPLHGLVDVLADMPWSWSVPVLGALGIAAAGYVGYHAYVEALELDVADDHLEHRTDGREGWVERGEVADVFRDGRYLVLLGATGAPRARLDADTLRPAELRAAFEAHGWPWRDADPYEDAYQRWVDGRPGFSSDEHALLRRRLAERKDAAAVAEVDGALAAHGLAARVRDDRLQVRRLDVGAPTDSADGPRGAQG